MLKKSLIRTIKANLGYNAEGLVLVRRIAHFKWLNSQQPGHVLLVVLVRFPFTIQTV